MFPVHCLKDTDEAELVDELKPFEPHSYVIEKNSTSAIFAEDFLPLIDSMTNLETIVGTGCESDICILNLFVPLKNYFNQKNRKVEIIVPENAIETFDSPTHSREEYNGIAKKLMIQSGIKVVKSYGENKMEKYLEVAIRNLDSIHKVLFLKKVLTKFNLDDYIELGNQIPKNIA